MPNVDQEQITHHCHECEKLARELERVRRALQQLVCCTEPQSNMSDTALSLALSAARAALSEGEPSDH